MTTQHLVRKMRKFLLTVRNFLFTFNPIRVWREEKQRDREVVVHIVSELCDTIRGQSDVMLHNSRIIETFLKGFQTTELPESRVIRAEDEIREAAQRYGITNKQLEEFDPFTPIM